MAHSTDTNGQPDAQALAAECDNLRQQLAARQAEVETLRAEKQKLEAERQEIKTQRDLYNMLYVEKLREEDQANPGKYEAEYREAMASGVDFGAFIDELEVELRNKDRHGG